MAFMKFGGLKIGLIAGAVLSAVVLSTRAAQDGELEKKDGKVVFRHVLDNEPIEFKYKTDQTITEAVETFQRTAKNPYGGQAEAIADGEKIYKKLCVSCHMKDGTGHIGPSLVDDKYKHERIATDKGKFEILYAGGAGAMQAFGRRITQDEILRVMAYVDELKAKSAK
jgi:cytochrome c-L